MATALVLIDFINEIVHENGKLASKGYSDFIKSNNVFQNLSRAVKKARDNNILIVHVRVGFSENYIEQPIASPLFGKAKEFQVLKLNSWATEFHEEIDVKENDVIVTKYRVNAFFGTSLDTILKNNKVDSILVAGVATGLAVSNTVRDAHDRDYNVTILEDCCAAANMDDHKAALLSLKKVAAVKNSNELI